MLVRARRRVNCIKFLGVCRSPESETRHRRFATRPVQMRESSPGKRTDGRFHWLRSRARAVETCQRRTAYEETCLHNGEQATQDRPSSAQYLSLDLKTASPLAPALNPR